VQLVNFYFDEFKPKPLSFDARFAAAVVLVVTVASIAGGLYQRQRATHLAEQLAAKQREAQQLLEQTQQLQRTLATKHEVQDWQNQIDQWQHRLHQYQQAMNLVVAPETGVAQPFSQVMADLSTRKARDLWLTQIDLSRDDLSLHGSSTDPESIPEYVAELKAAASLNREFDQLQINRNSEDERVVDFALLQGRRVNVSAN